jgi:Domain of unknown function (DUF929)
MSKTPNNRARNARPARPNSTRNPKNQSGRASGGSRASNVIDRRNAKPVSGIARFRREHPKLQALIPIALVVLALVALVVVKTTGGSSAAPAASKVTAGGSGATAASSDATPLPAGVLSDVTSVSPTTLAAIGDSSASTAPTSTGTKTALTASNGKPEILFIGAEYCPYCAAQRWSIVEALSQFGTFTGLSATHSSTTDVYPDTKTFSFYGSSYTSTSLDFTSVELETNQVSGNSYTTLQTPTAAQEAIFSKYDAAPYTSQPGSIPFLDIANKYVSIGSGYTPQVLQGLSMQQIASQLNNKNSAVAIAIDGEANRIVKAITAATGIQPTSGTAAAPATTTPTTAAGA